MPEGDKKKGKARLGITYPLCHSFFGRRDCLLVNVADVILSTNHVALGDLVILSRRNPSQNIEDDLKGRPLMTRSPKVGVSIADPNGR